MSLHRLPPESEQSPGDAWPITATVLQFRRLSGLGHSTTYKMIGDGRLETVALGCRRLIVVSSYLRLLERLRVDPTGDARRNAMTKKLTVAGQENPLPIEGQRHVREGLRGGTRSADIPQPQSRVKSAGRRRPTEGRGGDPS
jgi:hypothetical protein